MDISPRPKFVINLMDSCHGKVQGRCQEKHWSAFNEAEEPLHMSELGGMQGLEELDRRLNNFLRQCVLPVAIQTNAIVFTNSNMCPLSAAFGRLCEFESTKRNGHLPFTVVHTGYAENYIISSEVGGRIAWQLRTGSKRWRSSAKTVRTAEIKMFGLWEWAYCPSSLDPPPGNTHYIIVDTVTFDDRTKQAELDWDIKDSLSNNLVQQFASELPSIAFSTMNFSGGFGWDLDRTVHLASYVGRGLPLVMIDSRQWHTFGSSRDALYTPPATIEEAIVKLRELDKVLATEGRVNTYASSTLAFLHGAMNRELESFALKSRSSGKLTIADVIEEYQAEKDPDYDPSTVKCTSNQNRATEGEGHSFNESKKKHAVHFENKKQRAEHLNRIITQVTHALMELGREQSLNYPEFESQRESHRLDRFKGLINGAQTREKMNQVLRVETSKWCGIWGLSDRSERVVAAYPKIFKLTPADAWGLVLMVKDSVMDLKDAREALDHFVEEVWKKERRPDLLRRESSYPENDTASMSGLIDFLSTATADGISELLRSPMTFSANMDEVDVFNRLINKIARIDRLPQQNSLEALTVIQSAWEKVDIFSRIAKKCKIMAKITYITLLLVGLITTTIVTLSINGNLANSIGDKVDWIVLISTLFNTVLFSILAYFQPMVKWNNLRGAALALEAEIWKFRYIFC
jgi:hypothetical protein